MASLADQVDALLPQTQCTRCGYPDCRAYAQAIAEQRADINRCPPGGAAGVAALAELLGRAVKPLDPACGEEAPPAVAVIDEDACIGCTKCIQACPVDAIVGAGKRMHTVIADECTGCGLCLPPCPVDCIDMIPVAPMPLARDQVMARAMHARARFEVRNARLARDGSAPADFRTQLSNPTGTTAPRVHAPLPDHAQDTARAGDPSEGSAAPPITRSAVLEAIARGRARRAAERNHRE